MKKLLMMLIVVVMLMPATALAYPVEFKTDPGEPGPPVPETTLTTAIQCQVEHLGLERAMCRKARNAWIARIESNGDTSLEFMAETPAFVSQVVWVAVHSDADRSNLTADDVYLFLQSQNDSRLMVWLDLEQVSQMPEAILMYYAPGAEYTLYPFQFYETTWEDLIDHLHQVYQEEHQQEAGKTF